MENYIWLPVYSTELRAMAQTWIDGQNAKGKIPCKVVATPFESGIRKGIYRRLTGGCLRNITSTNKLYVLLHGSGTAEGRYIGGQRNNGSMKHYTPEQLVTLMVNEGLSKTILHVSLFSCGSGLGLNASFAARLKRAMVAQGYLFASVTGYLGDVKTSYAQRYISEHDDLITADTHKGVTVGDTLIRILPASSQKVIF